MSQPYLPEEEEVTLVDQFLNSGKSVQDVIDYANNIYAKSQNESIAPDERQAFFQEAKRLK